MRKILILILIVAMSFGVDAFCLYTLHGSEVHNADGLTIWQGNLKGIDYGEYHLLRMAGIISYIVIGVYVFCYLGTVIGKIANKILIKNLGYMIIFISAVRFLISFVLQICYYNGGEDFDNVNWYFSYGNHFLLLLLILVIVHSVERKREKKRLSTRKLIALYLVYAGLMISSFFTYFSADGVMGYDDQMADIQVFSIAGYYGTNIFYLVIEYWPAVVCGIVLLIIIYKLLNIKKEIAEVAELCLHIFVDVIAVISMVYTILGCFMPERVVAEGHQVYLSMGNAMFIGLGALIFTIPIMNEK